MKLKTARSITCATTLQANCSWSMRVPLVSWKLKWFLANMCKYISRVPKAVEEKKKEKKNPKAACDSKGSKEYEKNRPRKFSAKWQVGRPWLQHDHTRWLKWLDWPGGGGVNCWASENSSGRVHFDGYSPEWRVLSKLSVQPCTLYCKYTTQRILTPEGLSWVQHWVGGLGLLCWNEFAISALWR